MYSQGFVSFGIQTSRSSVTETFHEFNDVTLTTSVPMKVSEYL